MERNLLQVYLSIYLRMRSRSDPTVHGAFHSRKSIIEKGIEGELYSRRRLRGDLRRLNTFRPGGEKWVSRYK